MPAHSDLLRERLKMPAPGPDLKRLQLLERVVSAGAESPGQVPAIFRTDCGLSRLYWQEIQPSKKTVWMGLHEVLMARSREDLLRWVQGAIREVSAHASHPSGKDKAASEQAEQQRMHSLRRGLLGARVFAAEWNRFDPGTDPDRAVLGVRSAYERFLLVLQERMFLANTGVLGFDDWFRPPVEEILELNLEGLKVALEERWLALAQFFPPVPSGDAAGGDSGWVGAFSAAQGNFPAAAEIEAEVQELMRQAGLHARPRVSLTP